MEGKSSEKNLIPFAKPLGKSEFSNESSVIFELTKEDGEEKPGKIIRKADQKILSEIFKDIKDPLELEIKIKNIFSELENYGIKVPVEFVIGQEYSKEEVSTMFIVTDKIDGLMLSKVSKEDGDFLVKMEGLLGSLVDYLFDKLKSKNDEFFLWDIAKMNQYVYGTKRGEAEKEIYLVDTDPFIAKGIYEIFNSFLNCVYFLEWAEKKFETKIDSVRDKLKTLLEVFRNKIPDFKKYDLDIINRILGK